MTESAAPSLDAVQARRGGRSARVREAVLAATREELLARGYANVSHLAVARLAGVDPATVHRRWPTRARLATDALLDLADDAVPVPDTGTLRGDLEAFHNAVSAVLRGPRLLRLFQAFAAAASDEDEAVRAALRDFWHRRFDAATEMLQRGVQRGEIPAQPDPHAVIEQLVAPAYFRALVSGQPLDRAFTDASVDHTLTLANGH